MPCEDLRGQVPMWLGKGHTAAFRSGGIEMSHVWMAVMEAWVQCFAQSHQIVLLK